MIVLGGDCKLTPARKLLMQASRIGAGLYHHE